MSLDPFEGWEPLKPPGRGSRACKVTARLDRRGLLFVTKGLAYRMGIPPEGTRVVLYLHRMSRRIGLRIVNRPGPDTMRMRPKHSHGRVVGYVVGTGSALIRAGWDRDATIPPGQNSIELKPHYDDQTGLWWFQLPAKSFHTPPRTDGIRARLRQCVQPAAVGED